MNEHVDDPRPEDPIRLAEEVAKELRNVYGFRAKAEGSAINMPSIVNGKLVWLLGYTMYSPKFDAFGPKAIAKEIQRQEAIVASIP